MKDYMCKSCETIAEFQTKRTNEATRIKNACTTCNAVTTWEYVEYDLTDMTEAKREFLRRINPEITVNTASQADKTLHIPHQEREIMCGADVNTRKVDVAVYPLGYNDWCENCLHVASGKQSPDSSAPATDEEDVIKAIQRAEKEVDGTLTRNQYAAMNISPSTWTIARTFGSWTEAVEAALGYIPTEQ